MRYLKITWGSLDEARTCIDIWSFGKEKQTLIFTNDPSFVYSFIEPTEGLENFMKRVKNKSYYNNLGASAEEVSQAEALAYVL